MDGALINQIKPGICAVGYLSVPVEKYLEEANRPYFKVIGSGFLVRETTVMTNRHVIQGLLQAQNKTGFPDDQRVLQFVYPKVGGWQQAFCYFQHYSMAANKELDFGVIEFKRRPEPEFEQCRPLVVGNPRAVEVGQPIAALGYPYGTSMLAEEGRVYRFGTVLQQGYVSAIAPFDEEVPKRFLLDIRTAPGMSGCPIVERNEGKVIGVQYAGLEATTALALPLDDELVSVLLAGHDDLINERLKGADARPVSEGPSRES